jgi:hypothetical protein
VSSPRHKPENEWDQLAKFDPALAATRVFKGSRLRELDVERSGQVTLC